jgi:hypothetical protein
MLTHERCTICAEHTIGLEIVLHAPDETPRSCGSISFQSVWRQCLWWGKIDALFVPNVPQAHKSF